MTGPELGFLVLGTVLGVAAGIAFATVRRTAPRPSGEVRVTVTTDAIPRRSATLSSDATSTAPAPARGGPADHILRDEIPVAVRTAVRSQVATPRPAMIPAGAGAAPGASQLVAVPMGGGVDPLLDALRGASARVGTAVLDRSAAPSGTGTARTPVPPPEPTVAATDPEPPSATQPAGAPTAAASPSSTPPAVEPASGPCAELRLVADERCEVSARARQEAERAKETLRAARRSYDEELSRAEAAAQAADPRAIRAAKDAAQEAFRASRAGATTAEAVDAAARDWLIEVNRINSAARSATADAQRAQEAARALAGSLDRLTVEADAARIAADAADEACLAARQAVADCEEAAQQPEASMPLIPSGAPSIPWLDDGPGRDEDAETALRTGTAPTIFRLLEGDRETLVAVVERLAGEDPAERRRWQAAISDLVDAILATAIEGAALEFPEDHPFWGPFTVAQSRDIVAALASLGYRFDGLGGWQDGRVPSQRDLSLALGYAGLDPMRMRHWPNETEMATLFEPVRVAAPEYLAVAAGDLTLGELVTMLGPRADGLTEVWNAWGRIRPILLEER